MSELTADQLRAQRGKRKTRVVTIPDMDGTVTIRSWLGNERDGFEQWCELQQRKSGRIEHFRAKLVIMSVVGPTGHLMFEKAELEEVSEWPAEILVPIADEILALNKIGPKQVEELEKNSSPTLPDGAT